MGGYHTISGPLNRQRQFARNLSLACFHLTDKSASCLYESSQFCLTSAPVLVVKVVNCFFDVWIIHAPIISQKLAAVNNQKLMIDSLLLDI